MILDRCTAKYIDPYNKEWRCIREKDHKNKGVNCKFEFNWIQSPEAITLLGRWCQWYAHSLGIEEITESSLYKESQNLIAREKSNG